MPKKKGKDKGPPVPVGDLNIFGPLVVLKQVPSQKTTPTPFVSQNAAAQWHIITKLRSGTQQGVDEKGEKMFRI
jgi:hypothetical protein